MIDITYRPIDTWPGTLRRDIDRKDSPFDASWMDTLEVLDRELRHLSAKHIVCQLALPEYAFRLDGQPRADARDPEHPGVVLAFDSVHGPLKYATDVFRRRSYRTRLSGWQSNVRAIALGLEALRRVDRYGITKRGEQYTGWKALGAGIAMPAATGFVTLEDAARFIALHGLDELDAWVDVLDSPDVAYRRAAKTLHPDAGGDTEQFKQLTEAKRMLDEAPR